MEGSLETERTRKKKNSCNRIERKCTTLTVQKAQFIIINITFCSAGKETLKIVCIYIKETFCNRQTYIGQSNVQKMVTQMENYLNENRTI